MPCLAPPTSYPVVLWAVGPADIAPVSLRLDQRTLGCSADGRFLYLESRSPDGPVTVDRVTLADASSTTVLALGTDSMAHRVTR